MSNETPIIANDRNAVGAAYGPPDAAYVHVPFCRHRCGYCNFTLLAGHDDRIEDYLTALAIELDPYPRTPVATLFFGGGTPSHLGPDHLVRLAARVERTFPRLPGAEVSFEANPRDLESTERLETLAACGANRLSLGVQSFFDDKLALLERDHDATTVRRVVAAARPIFQSVSIDLIFGVPGESLERWECELDQALQLPIDHLSTYGLTIEKGTSFWNRTRHGELAVLDEELAAACYERTIDRLTAAGFEHYEVSNFARPGHRCRHNEVYWTDRPYFAVGPGAARYVDGVRETNHRSTTTWIRRLQQGQSPVAEREAIDPLQRARDRFVFGMRRLEGIEPTEFHAATGFRIEELAPEAFARFLEAGWFEAHEGRVRLTRAGLLISDSLWPEFL